jgi:hypothetical protein
MSEDNFVQLRPLKLMWIMFERHFEKRHFQYHLRSQKFGVVKVSEFSTAATVHTPPEIRD